MENKILAKRQSNFELLRIIAMLMIVASHLACHGVQHVLDGNIAYVTYNSGSFANKIFTSFLNPAGTVGVALFFMITGFFLCKKEKGSIKKVAFSAAFYSFALGTAFLISLGVSKIMGGGDGCTVFSDWNLRSEITYLITSFLRPVSRGWWFVTAYILFILCVPVINPFIKKLSKRAFTLFLLFIWAFYYSIDYVFGSEYLSLVRTFFFCILGAFIQLHLLENTEKIEERHSEFISESSEKVSHFRCVFRNLLLILICITTWLIMSFCVFKTSYVTKTEGINIALKIKKRIFQISNDCVSLPLFAFCFFRLFASLKIGSHAFINKIASATFGVYLIHDSRFGRSLIWNHILKVSEVQFASKYFPLLAVVDILIVFFVCVLIDLARQKFIEPKYFALAEKVQKKLEKV